jgi:exopolysaccharide biosynthesis protein
MSKDMDLDAILNEFKDYQGVTNSAGEKRAARRTQPAAAPETASGQNVQRPTTAVERAALRAQEAQQARPAPAQNPVRVPPRPRRARADQNIARPLSSSDRAALRDQSAQQSRPADRQNPREPAGARPADMLKELGSSVNQGGAKLGQGLRAARASRWFPVAVDALLILLCCLCLVWMASNIHPGSEKTEPGEINLAGVMDRGSAAVAKAAAAADPENPDAPVRPHYIIEEGALVAPEPDPACFGTIAYTEPEKVLPLIQQARDYGLLRADETVAFDPSVTFYHDDIEYYLDETILVICWKEVIDGNTCSFVEVKIADASQLRRKFADDRFASNKQYYSTVMHKSTNAVVTMNADFYQNRDFGIVVYNRDLKRFPTGTYTGSYTKYNCLETCFVNGEGDFIFTELGQLFTEESLKQYIADNDILFSLSFGPVLVRDGQVRQVDWYPVGEIEKGYSRAGIGQVDKLHYLYMSLNHSPEKEARWTVNQFALHFGEKPVKNAYCLDGGQTGEIVFQGRAYNHVDFVNGQSERPVSDNIYFATAIGGTEVYE